MDVLQINEHHQSVLHGYSQLNRYQRQQYLKSVQSSIKDVIKSKLLEDTYTRDEVTEMLRNVQNLVVDDLESELINILQSNILMLCQLFQQAEKWHLQLSIDLSEMQNKELLEKVKDFENLPSLKLDKPKLTPLTLNVEKTSEILRLEITNLQKEKEELSNDTKNLQEKILKLRQEQENMLIKIGEKDAIITSLQEIIERKTTEESLLHEQKNSDSEKILEDYDKVLAEQISHEIEDMKKKVNAAQAQLTLAEMELEKKFNSTAAYNNMKKIILKKNDLIKELRLRLSKYESLETSEMTSDHEEK